jgi:NAD(P)H-quinone oxidoreductase subunit 5
MSISALGPLFLRVLAAAIPATFGLSALRLLRAGSRPPAGRGASLRTAMSSTSAALVLALLVAAGGVLLPQSDSSLVRIDVVTSVMLTLVCSIAAVIVRYSRTYLAGEPGQDRYARALLATLAAVTVVVIANDLLVIVLAWMATSLALHQLLAFYDDRPQALVVAHKKFLLSRLADACLLAAVGLVGLGAGSLHLDVVYAWARSEGPLSPSLQLAAGLLVAGVSLKSAQLPFHGWLIQVMEAPTPVSALLHAGVVNIGGFVMIRLAPLMAEAPIAQTLLVVVGTITAVVAALVMTTRVSIKVSLAWSTCAQMGLMLAQCGLGAWHLALLHLVAHSLYKAHAFLSAGTTVDVWRIRALAPHRGPLTLGRVLVASVLVIGVVAAAYGVARHIERSDSPDGTLAPLAVLFGLSLLPLVARDLGGGSSAARAGAGAVMRSVAVTALYFAWHGVFGHFVARPQGAMPERWLIVLAGFVVLFAVQLVLELRPQGRLACVLQPRLFAGLYLDEIFTRMTFRLWPPRLRPRLSPRAALRVGATLEGR